MIRQFVLNYIRNHMHHGESNARNDIFRAITDGCTKAFYEDAMHSRLSWIAGELAKNDRQFEPKYAIRVANSMACEMLEIKKNNSKYPV